MDKKKKKVLLGLGGLLVVCGIAALVAVSRGMDEMFADIFSDPHDCGC